MTPAKTSEELDFKILSFIQKGTDHPPDDATFNELALELFEYQFTYNKPYQRYCKKLRISPEKISHWKEIPSVPTSAFKETALASFPPQKAQKVFYTSGTTQQRRGRHYLENLMLYENSLLINFKAHFGKGQARWPLLILTPSPQEAPHSSLCHMMGVLQDKIGLEENPYFLQKGQFLIEGFKKRLKQLCDFESPLILLGTAFSFVHFLDHALEKKWKVELPPGSQVMETGGYKGKSRELPKRELYELIHEVLGIPKTHIINEYGMTEMGSQFYDNTLINYYNTSQYNLREATSHKTIPPWVRTRVLDPFTLEELPPGQKGLLQHCDLANRSSVMALLTEDIGIKIKNGFEILGRAPNAEPRGCSIGVEAWIRSL